MAKGGQWVRHPACQLTRIRQSQPGRTAKLISSRLDAANPASTSDPDSQTCCDWLLLPQLLLFHASQTLATTHAAHEGGAFLWSQSVFGSTNHSVYHPVSPSAGPKPTTGRDATVSGSPVDTHLHTLHTLLSAFASSECKYVQAPQQQRDLLTVSYFLHLDSDCFGAMMCFQQKKCPLVAKDVKENGKKAKNQVENTSPASTLSDTHANANVPNNGGNRCWRPSAKSS